MSRLERGFRLVYRGGLWLLPDPIRRRYGNEMLDLFEEELAERRGLERILFVVRSFAGLGATAVLQRIPRRPGEPAGGFWWTRGLGLDLRLAARRMVRRPGLAAAIVATLVLGIGLNTAVFSLVNGLLLRPLPYGDPGRLVQLSETAPDLESMDVSLPDFHYWRTTTAVFSGMFAFDDHTFLLSTPDRPEILEGAVVSPGFMGVLGVSPALGREFLGEEERPGRNRVAVISESLWDRRFARDPGALGQALELNGRPYEIVGVAPPGFRFPEVAQVWIPLAFEVTEADPEDYGYDVIARLVPGAGLEAAREEGRRVAEGLAILSNGAKAGIGATAYPLRAADVPAVLAGTVLLLLVAVLLVLLVACTNVASLLLARGEERRGEMAVRLAIGAGVGRLLRQQLVEVALVATLGLLGALAMGRVAVDLLPRLLPGEVPFWLSFELDGRVLVWSGTLAALCCVAVALPTTVQARRAGAASRGLAGRRLLSSRGRTWLVGAQVALATMLVGSAAAAVKGVAYLSRAETGVRTDNILVTGAAIPPSSYPEAGDRIELARRALDAVRTLPSVVSAGGVDVVPLVSGGQEVALDDGSVGNDVASRAPVGLLNAFSPGYFETMGIPVLSGRLPVDADVWGDPTVAVVSQSLALRLWPEGEAVGRRIRYGAPGSRSPRVAADRPWLEVVAVVGDVSQEGPVRGTRDQVYVTMARQPPAHLTLMIRTRSDPLDQAGPVQQRIHEIDPVLPFFEPTTMAHARRFSVWTQRMTATLLSTFGLLAGLLAILGVYAVMAHTTRRRDREIGLRVAIGASRGDVRGLILRQSAGLVIPGLGAGLVGVGLASLVLRRVVVGIPAVDPVVLSATAVLLTLAALAAAWVPARRAAGIDPAAALSAD